MSVNRYRIIDGKKYNLEKRNLLCTVRIEGKNDWDFLNTKTMRLHCIKGKEFLLDTVRDFTGKCESCIKLPKQEAINFINAHPANINEPVYNKWFGEPEEAR